MLRYCVWLDSVSVPFSVFVNMFKFGSLRNCVAIASIKSANLAPWYTRFRNTRESARAGNTEESTG